MNSQKFKGLQKLIVRLCAWLMGRIYKNCGYGAVSFDLHDFTDFDYDEELGIVVFKRNKDITLKEDIFDLLSAAKDHLIELLMNLIKALKSAFNSLINAIECKRHGVMTFKQFSKEYLSNPEFRRKYSYGKHSSGR